MTKVKLYITSLVLWFLGDKHRGGLLLAVALVGLSLLLSHLGVHAFMGGSLLLGFFGVCVITDDILNEDCEDQIAEPGGFEIMKIVPKKDILSYSKDADGNVVSLSLKATKRLFDVGVVVDSLGLEETDVAPGEGGGARKTVSATFMFSERTSELRGQLNTLYFTNYVLILKSNAGRWFIAGHEGSIKARDGGKKSFGKKPEDDSSRMITMSGTNDFNNSVERIWVSGATDAERNANTDALIETLSQANVAFYAVPILSGITADKSDGTGSFTLTITRPGSFYTGVVNVDQLVTAGDPAGLTATSTTVLGGGALTTTVNLVVTSAAAVANNQVLYLKLTGAGQTLIVQIEVDVVA